MVQGKITAAGLRNGDLLAKAAAGDETAVSTLVSENLGLVRSIAQRFRERAAATHGCEFEDLMQIGTIGMIKAIKSYDASLGTAFSTYAVPLILGEIKRFLRDDGILKISRTVKKQNAMILHEREVFLRETGREPTVDELSEKLSIEREDLVFALASGNPMNSLSAAVGDDGTEFGDLLPSNDDEIEHLTDKIALREAIASLPAMERQIIVLRYFEELSQQQVADRIGITQVKVSREEKKIFAKLRTIL